MSDHPIDSTKMKQQRASFNLPCTELRRRLRVVVVGRGGAAAAAALDHLHELGGEGGEVHQQAVGWCKSVVGVCGGSIR